MQERLALECVYRVCSRYRKVGVALSKVVGALARPVSTVTVLCSEWNIVHVAGESSTTPMMRINADEGKSSAVE